MSRLFSGKRDQFGNQVNGQVNITKADILTVSTSTTREFTSPELIES